MDKIGLIAGNRRFPLLFAQKARQAGCYIVAISIKGDTSARLKRYVDKIYRIRVEEFNRIFEIFRQEGVVKIVMAGQINPRHLFNKRILNIPEVKSFFEHAADRRADSIFGLIAEKLEGSGFELLDSTTFIKDELPHKGVLTKRAPEPKQWEDINFGYRIAKAMGNLDIGQTVAVKGRAIVAVEALEGTDALIKRAGRIARAGVVIVKTSKPSQDIRFDIPVAGLKTVKTLIRAKASAMAIEADKTLFIDREQALRLADRKGICIVAV